MCISASAARVNMTSQIVGTDITQKRTLNITDTDERRTQVYNVHRTALNTIFCYTLYSNVGIFARVYNKLNDLYSNEY